MTRQASLSRRERTRLAGLQLLNQGMVLVPYVDPFRSDFRAGKYPHWRSFPARPQTDDDRRRVEVQNAAELDAALRNDWGMNIAVLGVVQVDTDNDLAEELAGGLGVSSSHRNWIIRTRRGWRVIYALPAREHDRRRNVTKNGASQEEIAAAKRGELVLTELDLLMNSPALVPPSIHPSGFHYQWVQGHTPTDIRASELQEPPPLLLSHWENITRPKRQAVSAPLQQSDDFGRAVLQFVEGLSDGRGVKVNSNGWTDPVRCPFGGHDNDANKRFSVNVKAGVWKCWTKHNSGSLKALVEEFKLFAPVRSRAGGGVRVEARIA